MTTKDFIFSLTSALIFVIVGVLLSLLFSSDPDFLMQIAGGAAWFVAALVLRIQMRSPQR